MKHFMTILILITLGMTVAIGIASAATSMGGPFTLTDQNRKQVSDSDFRGKLMMVFFGFTNCPDLCPTTLLIMSQTMEQLKEDSAKVVPIFVTIDPERDTPAAMKTFLGSFNPAIVGLTGTQAQIDKMQADYKTYSLKVDAKDAPGGHTFDHSGYIYLMDKQGKFLIVFTADSSPQTIAAKIREYAK